MKASIFIYPWDILDHGIESSLDQVKSLGFDQMNLAVNYHTARLLLPQNPIRKVYFTEPGATYFKPDHSKYDGPLRPYESTLTKGSDFLGDFVAKANSAGIAVNAWTVGLHSTPHGFSYPDLCVETAFGDRLLQAFCPSNPGARAYLIGMAKDLDSRYNFNAIEPETATFRPFAHGYHHEISGLENAPSLDYLLSLCFCESCAESASGSGVDISALRVKVRDAVSAAFEGRALPESQYDLPDMIDGLGDFIDWRKTVIEGLAAEVKRESCKNSDLAWLVSVAMPNSKSGFLYGADPAGLMNVADYVSICGYTTDAGALKDDLADVAASGMDMGRLKVAIRPQWPDCFEYDNFAAKLSVLSDCGVGAVGMFNFGTMQKKAFTWIEKAMSEGLVDHK